MAQAAGSCGRSFAHHPDEPVADPFGGGGGVPHVLDQGREGAPHHDRSGHIKLGPRDRCGRDIRLCRSGGGGAYMQSGTSTRGNAMRYGHFDDERREYVITRPDTPLPWINYSGPRTTSASSRTRPAATPSTGMPVCAGSPGTATTTSRWTRAAGTSTSATTARATTGRRRGSPRRATSTPTVPPRARLHDHRVRAARDRAETLYFVPLGETLEVWRLRVRNERAAPAGLSLFSAVEFCLWDA